VTVETLLIVDDDEESSLLLRDWLRSRGYHVDAVTSGQMALDHLHRAPANVVVTDLNMPGMSGIELCLELGKRHVEMLSIIVTGQGGPDIAAAAMDAGAYAFLTKPVEIDALAATIGAALAQLSARRT
jgi:DNA-binding NtrC family response regulator